jgi:mono/diheme cytochrome c family protein/YHS domain-containing protein
MNETLLQLAGRLHPMLLHLPIGVLGALLLVELWGAVRRRPPERAARLLLIWFLAASAGMSVGSGILLSEEPGYVGDVIEVHRWLGIVTAVAMLAAALLATAGVRRGYVASLIVAVMLIIPTGHLGGSMTHGEDFLTEPLLASIATPVKEREDEAPTWYQAGVAPILDAHCAACHGANRRKGGLALHTPEAIADGGSSGPVLGEGDASELLRRVRLPLTADEHMPPEGKPQLSPAQIRTLALWIESGASFEAPLRDELLAETPAATPPTPPEQRELPTAEVAALQAAHVHIEIVDPESTLLWIDFSSAPEMPLEEMTRLLTPLGPFASDLSMRAVPEATRVLARCGPWSRLRRLDLSHTSLDRAGLTAASASGHLIELTLVGSKLTPDAAEDLRTLESLEQLHVWGANIPTVLVAELRERRPALEVNDGTQVPPDPLEVEPAFTFGPAAITASLTPVNTACPVSGAPVDAKFSIVHEGRVVAFCCEVCAGKFWDDPGAYPVSPDRAAD